MFCRNNVKSQGRHDMIMHYMVKTILDLKSKKVIWMKILVLFSFPCKTVTLSIRPVTRGGGGSGGSSEPPFSRTPSQ